MRLISQMKAKRAHNAAMAAAAKGPSIGAVNSSPAARRASISSVGSHVMLLRPGSRAAVAAQGDAVLHHVGSTAANMISTKPRPRRASAHDASIRPDAQSMPRTSSVRSVHEGGAAAGATIQPGAPDYLVAALGGVQESWTNHDFSGARSQMTRIASTQSVRADRSLSTMRKVPSAGRSLTVRKVPSDRNVTRTASTRSVHGQALPRSASTRSVHTAKDLPRTSSMASVHSVHGTTTTAGGMVPNARLMRTASTRSMHSNAGGAQDPV